MLEHPVIWGNVPSCYPCVTPDGNPRMSRRTLTAETIGRIKPGPARIEVPDAVLPGLYLVIQPTGARSFAVRTRIDGKPVKLGIGKWPAMELAQARELARTKLGKVQGGIDPRAEKKKLAEVAKHTVSAVAEDWLKRDQAGNRDVAKVRRIMEGEVLPHIGDKQIGEVRKRDLIEVIDRVADRAPVRANRVLAHVKRLFTWAAGRDLIEMSPAQHIERPTPEKARERVLDDAELVTVWRAAERLGGAYGAGIRLLICTGARLSEIFEARLSELQDNALRLPAARSKSGEGRAIWLPSPAQAVVSALPRYADCDWLLTASGRNPFKAYGTSKNRLDVEIARTRAEARLGRPLKEGEAPSAEDALPAWRVHDIRRSVATGLQRLGTQLEVIEAVLGHISGSRAGIVGTYQKHGFEAEARKALARWGEHLERLLDPAPAKVVKLRAGR